MDVLVDYSKLTPDQKRELREQMEAEERAEKEKVNKMRSDYESLKEEQINVSFKFLQALSLNLEEIKVDIFNQFGAILAMKKELYNLSDEQMELQQSHTFTNKTNDKSLIIGSNAIDGWTDDVGIGIQGVNDWIDSKITDPDDRAIIRTLLRPDKSGALKANRVLELSNEAHKRGDMELIKHVNFIQSQYRPVKTSTYVKAKYKDENGIWQWLALTMSAV
jgi:hypothetical protein